MNGMDYSVIPMILYFNRNLPVNTFVSQGPYRNSYGIILIFIYHKNSLQTVLYRNIPTAVVEIYRIVDTILNDWMPMYM